MNTEYDGGPAFPTDGKNEYPIGNNGMSLRDYFAAKAMQGLCGDPTVKTIVCIHEIAYKIADAMIKESQKS